MLADIARAVEDARVYQREHGLAGAATRKLPSTLLHTLARWRERNRARRSLIYTNPESSPHGTGTVGDYTADSSKPSDVRSRKCQQADRSA